jgi:hypothetical protein
VNQCAACYRDKQDDSWLVCKSCQAVATRRLEEIALLHGVLSRHTWMLLPQKVESERPARGSNLGAPLNLHAASLVDRRTDARAALTPWVVEIHEHLKFSSPVPTDIDGLCQRLIALMPWCASELQAVGDMFEEIRHEHALLSQVVVGARKPPKPVRCPVVVPEEGECRGTLHLEGDGTVTCKGCGSVWPYEHWQRLGALLAT